MLAPDRLRSSASSQDGPRPGPKLPRPEGSDNAARLARLLRFRFRDLGLLRTALTHRSVLHEVSQAGIVTSSTAALTNERLEFLGDAVLGAVAAEYLYDLDPDADEGQLTRRRVALVRAETLVRWAREIDLGSYLYLGTGERPGEGARDRMLAGAFEAVIGAVALDRGFGAARKFLMRLLERDAPEDPGRKPRTWQIPRGACRSSCKSAIVARRSMKPSARKVRTMRGHSWSRCDLTTRCWGGDRASRNEKLNRRPLPWPWSRSRKSPWTRGRPSSWRREGAPMPGPDVG